MRQAPLREGNLNRMYFPSFWEGLSLRRDPSGIPRARTQNFPSFWEGLSLRQGDRVCAVPRGMGISLPFGRDFH